MSSNEDFAEWAARAGCPDVTMLATRTPADKLGASEQTQGPEDQWIVQRRKRGAEDETWERVGHFKTARAARKFMRGYPVLWPHEEWRIVKQVTTWEVVK